MRRKRRTRYTWFPTVGVELTDAEPGTVLSGRPFSVTVPQNGVSTEITPLTIDTPAEAGDLDTTAPGALVGIVGQEYVIERIVGKLFAGLEARRNAGNDPSIPQGALFGAGLFVARAADADAGGGNQVPIGAASAAERNENYSPLTEDPIREPWMWRRTWMFGNINFRDISFASQIVTFNSANSQTVGSLYPPTTAHYGSIQDGPHVDVKSVRRVRQDERLWLAVSTASYNAFQGDPGAAISNNAGVIRGYFDFRILAALRRAKNRSNF